MASFPREGDITLGNTEDDTSADSPSETNDSDQPQSSEGEENSDVEEKEAEPKFNEHPRWKEREDDWKDRFNDQEKRHSEAIDKIRQEFREKAPQERSEHIPEWFGGDEKQWKDYNRDLSSRDEKIRESVKKELSDKEESNKKALDSANEYLNAELDFIQNDKNLNPDGVKVDKNKLLAFTLNNEIVDSQGRWNYRIAHQLMQAKANNKKSKALKDRKEIAGATTSEKGVESKPPTFMTNQDFKNPTNRPW